MTMYRLCFTLLAFLPFVAGGCGSLKVPGFESDRPNILWITAEDLSPALGCYGDAYATTPHLNRLAGRSVRYTNAFATAPICSPSRSCLINGVFATTQGTHPMRSTFPVPEAMSGFPALLREAGYYTTNNAKTDYNTGSADRIIGLSWDESSDKAHWRNRPKEDQPFFSVFNLMTSHQSRSMVWPYEKFKNEVQSELKPEQIHDPAKAPLPPYYPDTPVVRKTVARFYDCVTAMDRQVGDLLEQLENDGLADDTIVFFYGDHGNGMPRHKRALLDSGMKVPLLIHFPQKYAHLAPVSAGKTTDRLTSFVDYGPTVLSLAGLRAPGHMQGHPFLGRYRTAPRRYVYGHRDRCDEAMDKARSVRDKRYLYIRNYMPHLGYHQPSAWVDQGDIRHEFVRLAKTGRLTPAQRHYVGPNRPREELYDCQTDPMNLRNLAELPEHRQTLRRMRKAHRNWLTRSKDLGFVHEIELERIARKKAPYLWARKGQGYDPARHLAVAEAVGTDSAALFVKHLADSDPSVRYWAVVGLGAMTKLSKGAQQALNRAMLDSAEAVRIEAASALARHGRSDEALPVLLDMLKHRNVTVQLYAARAIELMGEKAAPAAGPMQALNQKYRGKGDPHMFVFFATEGFLKRLHGQWP